MHICIQNCYVQYSSSECQTTLIGAGLVSPQGTSHNLTVEKDALNMSRFLNRILGLPVKLQNQLFSYFTDTLAAVCQQAKKLGKWDGGIQDFGAQGDRVEVIETKEYVGDPAFCTATTQLVKVSGNQLCMGRLFYSEVFQFFFLLFLGEG